MQELALPEGLLDAMPWRGRPKAAIQIASRLRMLIVHSGVPGDALPSERVLVERFGVSRPTVREALRVLEVEGLVEIRRGVYGGAIVRDVGTADMARMFGVYLQRQGATIGDLFDFRMLVEPAAAAQAAEIFRRGEVAPQTLLSEESLTTEYDPQQLATRLAGFHEKVLEFADNKALSAVLVLLKEVIEQHYTANLATQNVATRGEWASGSHKAHKKIARAIQSGDSQAAAAAMKKHLSEVRKGLDGSDHQVITVLSNLSASASSAQ